MASDDSFTTRVTEAVGSFGVSLVATNESSLLLVVSITTTLPPLKPGEPSEG